MAATVYSTPEELPEPVFDEFFTEGGSFNSKAYFEACAEHTAAMAAWVRERSDSDIAGETISFPVADGKAIYMVYTTSPKLWLIHLAYVDGYQVDPMMLRGMRVADVREKVRQEKAIAEIFGRRS